VSVVLRLKGFDRLAMRSPAPAFRAASASPLFAAAQGCRRALVLGARRTGWCHQELFTADTEMIASASSNTGCSYDFRV
jgi:hypothetical protein